MMIDLKDKPILEDLLNNVLESEQDSFTVCLEEGLIDPKDGCGEEWEEKVDRFFDDESGSYYCDKLLDEIALISKGHIFCDALYLQSKYL